MIEIVSNNTAAVVREVQIGNQYFIVRKTNIPISNENVKVLQLLELLKRLDSCLDGDYDDAREKIRKHSLANHITRDDVSMLNTSPFCDNIVDNNVEIVLQLFLIFKSY